MQTDSERLIDLLTEAHRQMLTLAFKVVSKERDHYKQMAFDQARMSPIPIT